MNKAMMQLGGSVLSCHSPKSLEGGHSFIICVINTLQHVGSEKARVDFLRSHSTSALVRRDPKSVPALWACDFLHCIRTPVPHTPVKVDYSLVHTVCAGLNGKVLTEKGQWKKNRKASKGLGEEENPLLNSE